MGETLTVEEERELREWLGRTERSAAVPSRLDVARLLATLDAERARLSVDVAALRRAVLELPAYPDGMGSWVKKVAVLELIDAALQAAVGVAALRAALERLRRHHVSQDCHPGHDYADACTNEDRSADRILAAPQAKDAP